MVDLVPTDNTELVADDAIYHALYKATARALAEARTVSEVNSARAQSIGLHAYARRARDGKLAADTWELRFRAERKLGQMMAEQRDTVGLATGGEHGGRTNIDGVRKNPSNPAPTLAAAGIDKNLAKAARSAAAIFNDEFEEIIANGRARIIDELDRFKRRIINITQRAATKRRSSDIPDGKYQCIVIDPPWPMEKIEREVRPNQVGFEYPVMSEDELAEFDVVQLAANDCHLFCWTTQRFKPMAARLVDQWGFDYVCTFVWHKPGGFQPVGLPQYNCEFVIYARVGVPRFVDTKAFPTCFEAPRREHSRKPDEFYNLVRRTTAGPRIDIFSREPREGFAQYGNEPEKFSQ